MDIPRTDWFSKEFMKIRDKWIAAYGYQALCEDAGKVGVDGIEFPEVVEVKYRCTRCSAPMVARTGPFGEFLACPAGTKIERHPTQKMPKDFHNVKETGRIERFHPVYSQEPLLVRIEREMEDDNEFCKANGPCPYCRVKT